MDHRTPENDTLERREESARRALHAYQERRRRRRADDTYFGSTEYLLGKEEREAGRAERERRRSAILEIAGEIGIPESLAELLYDIALEEGLDPVLALELVSTGLGVQPPEDGVSNASEAPSVDKYLPTWIFPPEPTDALLRERTLRFSFRRLRRLLEEHDEVEEAFRAFANEPDVGHYGY